MLLIRKIKDARMLIGLGQIFLVLGLVGLYSSGVISGEIEKTFWNGFLLGLSGVLLGLSVPLNIVGLMRIDRQKKLNS
ncbi:hypothetical protein HQ585_20590 [candidate division KSB1 bacterium]|nr:hypothetical protein [candidate division KSB1 bacterium]